MLWLGIEFRVSGRTIEPSDYRHDPRSSLFKSTIFIVQNVFKEIVITVAGEFSIENHGEQKLFRYAGDRHHLSNLTTRLTRRI